MIKNVEPSLEDVFLKITGRKAEEKTIRGNNEGRRRPWSGGFH
jgi:hypothetical protein